MPSTKKNTTPATPATPVRVDGPRQVHAVTPVTSWTKSDILEAMASANEALADSAKTDYAELAENGRYVLTLTSISHQLVTEEMHIPSAPRAVAVIVSSATIAQRYA